MLKQNCIQMHPAGWEEGERSVVRVGGILDDGFYPCQGAFVIYVPSGGYLLAGDHLASFHQLLECWRVNQHPGTKLSLRFALQEVTVLLHLSDEGGGVQGPD